MDDYWLDQRYEDTYLSIHGHMTWQECPACCKGRGDNDHKEDP